MKNTKQESSYFSRHYYRIGAFTLVGTQLQPD